MGVFNSLFPQDLEAYDIISPVAQAVERGSASVLTASYSAELIPEPTPTEYTQEEIEKYVKTIFGKDSKVAIAISHNECNPANKRYPKCNLKSHVENSVGLFQINIESATAKVHWARIPNDTLEEKKEWLENPYNNTLLAYWIFKTSGWNPWSAYTNGNYLRDM